MLQAIFSILVFLIAVSVDSVTAGLTYGTSNVRIKPLAYLLLICVPAAFITISNRLGEFLYQVLPKNSFPILSFLIFFLMACSKILESLIRHLARKYPSLAKNWGCKIKQLNIIFTIYLSPEDANKEDTQVLTAKEALFLSLALSLDSILVGMAFHIVTFPWILLFFLAAFMNYLFFIVGYGIGRTILARSRIDLSWLSGLFLLVLALLALS